MRPIVIVTGSHHGDVCPVFVRAGLAGANPRLVVQGGAAGVDAAAKQWAADMGIPCATFEADWHRYGKRAGPLRNEMMLRAFDCGLLVKVLAWPGPLSRGTWHCVRAAEARGFEVKVFPFEATQ